MVTTKQQRLHSATEVHPFGTWGNCPVGVARAAGYQNVDAVLAKQFSAGGSRYFEFRAEAFNLTNTPSFGPPARDISNTTTLERSRAPSAQREPWSWCSSSSSSRECSETKEAAEQALTRRRGGTEAFGYSAKYASVPP
jgi:hypothetical protein